MTICTKLISTWKVQIAKQNKTLSSNHTKTATSPRSRTLSIEKMKIVWNKLSFAFSPFYARFVHTYNLGTFMVDISNNSFNQNHIYSYFKKKYSPFLLYSSQETQLYKDQKLFRSKYHDFFWIVSNTILVEVGPQVSSDEYLFRNNVGHYGIGGLFLPRLSNTSNFIYWSFVNYYDLNPGYSCT